MPFGFDPSAILQNIGGRIGDFFSSYRQKLAEFGSYIQEHPELLQQKPADPAAPSNAREVPWWENFLNYYVRPSTDFLTMGLSEIGWQNWDKEHREQDQQIADILASAKDDPTAALGKLADLGLNVTPETEKWLDNLIAQQNTANAQDFAREQSQTDLLNAAKQLESLGLSASGVLQTGGSSTNAVSAASNPTTNLGQQRFAQRMAVAKQLLGMTSQMASAGVYGHAFGAAKKAAGIVAAATAHSGVNSIKTRGIKRSRALQRFIDESSALEY